MVQPTASDAKQFSVLQPGSSVATALSEGESKKKHVVVGHALLAWPQWPCKWDFCQCCTALWHHPGALLEVKVSVRTGPDKWCFYPVLLHHGIILASWCWKRILAHVEVGAGLGRCWRCWGSSGAHTSAPCAPCGRSSSTM